jgi:hypothetical protein
MSHEYLTSQKPSEVIEAPRLICLRPPIEKQLPEIDAAQGLLENAKLTAPPTIITGLLHKGTKAVLAAPSKVGKTWLLLYLAICIATGTRFLKWLTTQGHVLYINLEIHRTFIKDRLQLICQRMGITSIDNLDIWTLRGQSADMDALTAEIIRRIENTPYGLIIIDPIYKLSVGRSENTASGVGLVCNKLEQLVEKTGAAVLFAHHFTKGNQAKKKAIDRLSGSGVYGRDADTIITLTEHAVDGCYSVETTLRNLPPQEPFVLEWDFPLMVERDDLDPTDLKTSEHSDLDAVDQYLLSFLDEKPRTTTEWRKVATYVSKSTLLRRKDVLEKAGLIACSLKDKTWSRTKSVIARSPADTRETCDTSDTTEKLIEQKHAS